MHTLEAWLSDQPFEIPEVIQKRITKRLAVDLIEEMERVLKRDMLTPDINGDLSLWTLVGSKAWEDALVEAARKHKLGELIDWYEHLPWYESETFDAEVYAYIENNVEAIRSSLAARRKAKQSCNGSDG